MSEKTREYFDAFWTPDNIEKNRLRVRRTVVLFTILKRLEVDHKAALLELGSGAGRNLEYLYYWGYRNLEAIEFNQTAIDAMRKFAPVLSKVYVHPMALEDFDFSSKAYDVIFSVATLLHIPDIKKIARGVMHSARQYIITMEDEMRKGDVHFKRNYRKVFHKHPFEEIAHWKLNTQDDLPRHGYHLRVFRRNIRRDIL